MSGHLYISSSCKIDNHSVFKSTIHLLENEPAADDWLIKIYQQLGLDYPRFYKMDNLCKLGWLATEILLQDKLHKKYSAEDVGIVLTNKSSSLDTDIKYFETVKSMASPALFVYTLPNIVIGEISIRHHLKGENAMFVSEEFDAAFLQRYVQDLFATNALVSCVCGWLEFFDGNADAAFYLVEKVNNGTSVPFTTENIHTLYQLKNGETNSRS